MKTYDSPLMDALSDLKKRFHRRVMKWPGQRPVEVMSPHQVSWTSSDSLCTSHSSLASSLMTVEGHAGCGSSPSTLSVHSRPPLSARPSLPLFSTVSLSLFFFFFPPVLIISCSVSVPLFLTLSLSSAFLCHYSAHMSRPKRKLWLLVCMWYQCVAVYVWHLLRVCVWVLQV